MSERVEPTVALSIKKDVFSGLPEDFSQLLCSQTGSTPTIVIHLTNI